MSTKSMRSDEERQGDDAERRYVLEAMAYNDSKRKRNSNVSA